MESVTRNLVLTVTIATAILCSADAALGQKRPAPLFNGLGDHHHPVRTHSKLAQRYFDQGLTLCYGFNHHEAIRSFRAAAEIDPNCAMAYWGIAYAYGPNINNPLTKDANDQAWEALRRAIALRPRASRGERAYIDALSKRYEAEFREDRSSLDKAYAAAMRELAKKYPDDLDAQTLFAEALMDTMPWNYWSEDLKPKKETEEVHATLRYVIDRNPDHPGANHFYIHAIEAGPTPELGLPSADRLAEFTTQAGHLIHMPSHIYMRVGQYHKARVANERATRADQSYIRHCKAQGFYPGVYYPHNVHFLWYANLFEGRSKAALAAARKVAEYAAENLCGPTTVVEAPRFRHLAWLTMLRFGRWEEILNESQPPTTNQFLVDRVLWHFARGMAQASLGESEAAVQEHALLTERVNSELAKTINTPIFPATDVLAIAEHLLAGKVAQVRGDDSAMIAHLKKAVAAEDALPYMEPAYWPYPTRPTLGAAYLNIGDPIQAEAVFREDLKKFNRNGWGLRGLEESLRRQGKSHDADNVQRQFQEAWKHADVELDLSWF